MYSNLIKVIFVMLIAIDFISCASVLQEESSPEEPSKKLSSPNERQIDFPTNDVDSNRPRNEPGRENIFSLVVNFVTDLLSGNLWSDRRGRRGGEGGERERPDGPVGRPDDDENIVRFISRRVSRFMNSLFRTIGLRESRPRTEANFPYNNNNDNDNNPNVERYMKERT